MKTMFTALVAVAACAFALPSHAQAPSDPQIVGIVVAANQIDIDAGNLALKKAHSQQTRDFAKQMVADHSALQKSVFALGAKLHVTPAESGTQASLKKEAAETMEKLKGLKGAAFDKAYIDHEVAYHKQVIDAVSTVLIPNAKNDELKSALQGAAPLFQGHLEHAEHLQASASHS